MGYGPVEYRNTGQMYSVQCTLNNSLFIPHSTVESSSYRATDGNDFDTVQSAHTSTAQCTIIFYSSYWQLNIECIAEYQLCVSLRRRRASHCSRVHCSARVFEELSRAAAFARRCHCRATAPVRRGAFAAYINVHLLVFSVCSYGTVYISCSICFCFLFIIFLRLRHGSKLFLFSVLSEHKAVMILRISYE